ncbi:hypothetical protein K402DRAFT_405929 [Aulographum hederae CBS 113979]|uniref:Uncharacterized protein n=1 Tax=Aulographum hederae CBS 113979 TaxID=1176131 RepID=A0A6G1GUB3_9PEZI|nr:hypothetical protein K402DRAFT_405929 [Aulographum hederae CBS 113979]
MTRQSPTSSVQTEASDRIEQGPIQACNACGRRRLAVVENSRRPPQPFQHQDFGYDTNNAGAWTQAHQDYDGAGGAAELEIDGQIVGGGRGRGEGSNYANSQQPLLVHPLEELANKTLAAYPRSTHASQYSSTNATSSGHRHTDSTSTTADGAPWWSFLCQSCLGVTLHSRTGGESSSTTRMTRRPRNRPSESAPRCRQRLLRTPVRVHNGVPPPAPNGAPSGQYGAQQHNDQYERRNERMIPRPNNTYAPHDYYDNDERPTEQTGELSPWSSEDRNGGREAAAALRAWDAHLASAPRGYERYL